MSDFIREVDEGVRQDQFRRFLERYWIVLVALVILILAGVGAWEGYDYLRTQRAQSAGGQYLDALDLTREGKSEEAQAALRAVIAEGTPGYRLLARFRLAGEIGSKDKAAGAKLFDEIAADPTVDPALQNVARLRAGVLVLDTASYADFKTRMEPLADANSPLRNAARELLALAALKADRSEEAGRSLDAIVSDPTASGQVRQRVEALQGLVRGAGSAPAVPAPAAGAAAPAPAAEAPRPSPNAMGTPEAAVPAPAVPNPAPTPDPTPAAPAPDGSASTAPAPTPAAPAAAPPSAATDTPASAVPASPTAPATPPAAEMPKP